MAVHTANFKAFRGPGGSLIITHMFNERIFCSLQRPSGVINMSVNMKNNYC